ncbi:MAG: HAMP domain-containing histidine kinase [Bacteroidetes bacterium]|nr:HAMP domain-containing histidine kinase [Bacteroidota bacterium]
MTIYDFKDKWKLFLMISATMIVAGSLWYTNKLVQRISEEERKNVQLWADATSLVITTADDAAEDANFAFLFQIIELNETVPIILTDGEDNILNFRNLDSAKIASKSEYLPRQLKIMKAQKERIEIDLGNDTKNFIYYKDSDLLTMLKYYPYAQWGIITLFLLIAYLAFNAARNAEQNKVWTGLAKETAHQLGTPISSLLGWVELFKNAEPGERDDLISEIENDISRLEQITERFSKVGSKPVLDDHNVNKIIANTVNYLKKRSSEKVTFKVNSNGQVLNAKLNAPLFDWVIENLLKNALNALGNEGTIQITPARKNGKVIIDVKDDGKGIPKSKFKTVFKPGYTTRQRGWGLGLSLCKRIIENYHNGKIFVKESTVDKGTTFRIVLPN